MLRYLETVGLIEPPRTGAGYRIFGPAELQRLRTLRELLDRHGLGPSDVAFARRLRDDSELEDAVARWLEAKAEKPADVRASDWLDYEQQKHQRLLAA
jgi:DNA-binding transcriptional MerR regulator